MKTPEAADPYPYSTRNRGRRLPLTLWRYVAQEFCLPLVCCVACFVLLFMVLDIFDVLQDLMGAKAPLGQMMGFFLLGRSADNTLSLS